MKPHLQCAEQLVSPSNLTKYCACHANGSSSSQIKPHLQCAKQLVSPSNLTKYCACQTKRLTFGILITHETSCTMRRATGVTIKPHQILRLSRKWFILITDQTSFTISEATSVTIKPHQILRLSHKKAHIRNPHHI